jgi:hypothetical protein
MKKRSAGLFGLLILLFFINIITAATNEVKNEFEDQNIKIGDKDIVLKNIKASVTTENENKIVIENVGMGGSIKVGDKE